MKKIFIFIALLLPALFVIGGAMAHADPVGAFDNICTVDGSANSTVCRENATQTQNSNPILGNGGILTKAINLITFLTGVASIIIIILGGIKYVVSTGDPGKVGSAKDTILYAVIGLLVSVSARGIILFVVNRVK